jgi:hypothetical protein
MIHKPKRNWRTEPVSNIRAAVGRTLNNNLDRVPTQMGVAFVAAYVKLP